MPTIIKPKINRAKFFNKVRDTFFDGKLSQSQVIGMTDVLNEWDKRGLTDLRWLAYMFATIYHETARTMQPISEYGKGKGKPYGKPGSNGQIFFGRGFVQLTWEANYKTMGAHLGIDLFNHPDMALDCEIATQILFEGMTLGLFTGKKLSDYFDDKIVVNHYEMEKKWINARKIINGTDLAELIASYAKKFYSALL